MEHIGVKKKKALEVNQRWADISIALALIRGWLADVWAQCFVCQSQKISCHFYGYGYVVE